MKVKKLGAIDIGSNAVRLMIANVFEKNGETSIKKVDIIRLPVRLGADVFVDGKVSNKNYKRMVDAMTAFKYVMKVHKLDDYRAYATSAMRNASNGEELIKDINKKSGIDIDIIDGKKEAAIIFSTKLSDLIDKHNSYVYIDVGGGSTEITVFSKGEIIGSRSFRVGAVRILNDKVSSDYWTRVEAWVKEKTQGLENIEAIGSGGNINKLFKMSLKPEGTTLSAAYLFAQMNYLKSYTFEQRVEELGLNEDRADVLIPAAKIYLSVMRWSKAEKIHVPKIGLVDGIIRSLYKGTI